MAHTERVIMPDDDTCFRALQGKDARFDGWFFSAVRTTGIYCRPSCPATPLRRNVTFLPSAAAAQRAGYRACKRCRPDASPGSPEWDVRGDLAGRALRLIADGVIDRDGVPGLAKRLGYSERQLNRTLVAEVGAGPLALARAQRAQTARVLLETTDLPATDVAFAAGFASVRQFNDTIQAVFATTPTSLRSKRRGRRPGEPGEAGALTLRLPYRAPMDLDATLDYLAGRAIPGVEAFTGGTYSRVVDAPHGPALITVSSGTAGEPAVSCQARLTDQRDLVAVVARVRRLLDLDADPVAVDAALSVDPVLEPLVGKHPGRRSPGAVDGFELAVRAVIGQQISVSGARTVLGRLVSAHGRVAFAGEPWRVFPDAATLAGIDPSTLPMPRARGRTLVALAATVAAGDLALNPGADRERVRATLMSLPGIGAWTADYVRMRALADPDVLLTGDLAIVRAAAAVGATLDRGRPDWAPWRSYASHQLWATLH